MIIATSITSDYFRKSMPFFDSVNKNFKGERICFCIGFHAELEGWKMVYVDPESILCKWKPKNRKSYTSLQHGEFVRFYRFKDDDQVMFIDSDMILQRSFQTELNDWGNNFLVSNSSFPPTLLSDAAINISNNESSINEFLQKYDGKNEKEFCAALIIGSVNMWRRLYQDILFSHKDFLQYFDHHAAWQLLINYIIIKHHSYKILPPLIQNAEWYSGTEARVIDDQLVWKDEVVYFNHTKFNRIFKY